MSKCMYCGNENADLAVNCAGCGNILGADEDVEGVDPGDVNFNVAVARTYATEAGARLALGALENAGIAAYLGTDDCGGMLPSLQHGRGVRLLVDAAEVERTRAFLDEWEGAPPLEEGRAMSSPPPLPPPAVN